VNIYWIDLRLERIVGAAAASTGPSGTTAVLVVLVAFALVALAIIVADYWLHRRDR
jgi:hypothetical protein